MKLKAIMYALAYKANEAELKRKEGARRVKQAQKLMWERKAEKMIMFPSRYGCSSKALYELTQQRQESLVAGYVAIYGNDFHRSENKGENSIDNLTWCH